MRLALFDLDNTLLAGDSDYEWGQFLVDRGILEREAYEAPEPRLLRPVCRRHARHPRVPRLRAAPARRAHAGGSCPLARRFHAQPHPAHGERRGARARARATSSAAICAPSSPPPTASSPRRSRANSASPHLIATEPESPRRTLHRAGRRHPLLPRRQGARAWRTGSAPGAGASMSSRESSFYSDSHNDLPLLERVRVRWRSIPTPSSRARRARRGWERIYLRR